MKVLADPIFDACLDEIDTAVELGTGILPLVEAAGEKFSEAADLAFDKIGD